MNVFQNENFPHRKTELPQEIDQITVWCNNNEEIITRLYDFWVYVYKNLAGIDEVAIEGMLRDIPKGREILKQQTLQPYRTEAFINSKNDPNIPDQRIFDNGGFVLYLNTFARPDPIPEEAIDYFKKHEGWVVSFNLNNKNLYVVENGQFAA